MRPGDLWQDLMPEEDESGAVLPARTGCFAVCFKLYFSAQQHVPLWLVTEGTVKQ